MNKEDLEPGQRVYRWWYSYADNPNPQPLTVVRVNQKSVTVRTDQGGTFRMAASDLAGTWNLDEWVED